MSAAEIGWVVRPASSITCCACTSCVPSGVAATGTRDSICAMETSCVCAGAWKSCASASICAIETSCVTPGGGGGAAASVGGTGPDCSGTGGAVSLSGGRSARLITLVIDWRRCSGTSSPSRYAGFGLRPRVSAASMDAWSHAFQRARDSSASPFFTSASWPIACVRVPRSGLPVVNASPRRLATPTIHVTAVCVFSTKPA